MKRGIAHPATEVIRKALNDDARSAGAIATLCGLDIRSLQYFANGKQEGLYAGAYEKLVPVIMPGYGFGLFKLPDQQTDDQKREERPACDSGTL